MTARGGLDLADRRVVVAGGGISGAAAARVLVERGACVTVVDAKETVQTAALERAGARVVVAELAELPRGTELVVTSPGWRPDHSMLVAAGEAGIPIWGEVELAWRLRTAERAGPWLGVTGTNGKTTTTQMLASILTAAGYQTVATGNIGTPLVEAVLADPPYDVLAVELSSFQLHWSSSVACLAAVILNLAPDHLDWHGCFEEYVQDKARIWQMHIAANPWKSYVLYNGDDRRCTELAKPIRDTQCFTLGEPGPHCIGVVDGLLVDRFSGLPAPEPDETVRAVSQQYRGVALAAVGDVPLPGPHNLANALAAAGLARQLNFDPRFPVPARAVRDGLRACAPGLHRNQLIGTFGGVRYVDDSKATNPHAAAASLSAYDQVVWIAGGQLKGATVDGLVSAHRGRLRAAVLLGVDRAQIAAAFARHAPNVPVISVDRTDTGAMHDVVAQARRLARPDDTVLLAPAAASTDMFTDYAERGALFAAAVLEG